MTAPLRVAVEGVGEVVVPFAVSGESYTKWILKSPCIELFIQPGYESDVWDGYAEIETEINGVYVRHEVFAELSRTAEEAVSAVLSGIIHLLSDEMKAKLRGEK